MARKPRKGTVSAKSRKGRQLTPSGHKWFKANLLPWLRKRKAGVKESSIRVAKPRTTLGARALNEARKLLGTLEQGGNNRGPTVDKIIRENGGTPGEAWCGDFDAHCYRKAGSKSVTRSWAAVRFLGRISGQGRIKTSQLRAGDILIWDGHTNLFAGWATSSGGRTGRAKATHVRTIGGNEGTPGGVRQNVFPLSALRGAVRVYR